MSDFKSAEELKNHLITKLSEFIGVEVDDISDDDLLDEDLHLSSMELTDFIESLKTETNNLEGLKLDEVESVGELVDQLAPHFGVI